MKDELTKKSKSLKAAIERFNTFNRFVEIYKSTRSLDEFVTFTRLTYSTLSEDSVNKHERMIYAYELGDSTALLTDLYDRLLSADDYKNKLADEIKNMLRECR